MGEFSLFSCYLSLSLSVTPSSSTTNRSRQTDAQPESVSARGFLFFKGFPHHCCHVKLLCLCKYYYAGTFYICEVLWHYLCQGTFLLRLPVISYTSIFIYISLNHWMQPVGIILPLGTSLRLNSSLSSSCPHYHFQNPLHYRKQQQPPSCCLHTEDLSVLTSPSPKCLTKTILANHCDNMPSVAEWWRPSLDHWPQI